MCNRRAKVEQALAWKKRLDHEETEIKQLEAQVAAFTATLPVDVEEMTMTLSGKM